MWIKLDNQFSCQHLSFHIFWALSPLSIQTISFVCCVLIRDLNWRLIQIGGALIEKRRLLNFGIKMFRSKFTSLIILNKHENEKSGEKLCADDSMHSASQREIKNDRKENLIKRKENSLICLAASKMQKATSSLLFLCGHRKIYGKYQRVSFPCWETKEFNWRDKEALLSKFHFNGGSAM